MTPVLVDSNVIFDILREDPEWREWSETALRRAAAEAPVLVNPIVYAEISARFDRAEEVDRLLEEGGLEREDLPWPAAFLAGRAHQAYRRRGGERRSPLPDFFIGAHAAARGYALLTRDARRYRTYFPMVELITPDAA